MIAAKELRVHLGAHKTATTHLQDTLAAHRPALLDHDVDILSGGKFKPLVRRDARTEGLRHRLWRYWPGLMSRQFITDLERLSGAHTLLLSDEDLLGHTDEQITNPLYPKLRGLHLIRRLADRGAKVSLFLGIRSLDGLVPSAYAQMLKSLPPPEGGMEAVRARLAENPPSWTELIERIREELPGMELRVWRYEDYQKNWRDILRFYVGRDTGEFPDLPPPPRTASPSARAISLAEKVDPALPRNRRREEVKGLYARYPADGPDGSYRPLTEAEIARFRESYAADLREIERRFPGVLVRLHENA
jgi:hypothetical protein